MSASKLSCSGCGVCTGRGYASTDKGMCGITNIIGNKSDEELKNFVTIFPCATFFYAFSKKDERVARAFVSVYDRSQNELAKCNVTYSLP